MVCLKYGFIKIKRVSFSLRNPAVLFYPIERSLGNHLKEKNPRRDTMLTFLIIYAFPFFFFFSLIGSSLFSK
jgi:hypothetical protein